MTSSTIEDSGSQQQASMDTMRVPGPSEPEVDQQATPPQPSVMPPPSPVEYIEISDLPSASDHLEQEKKQEESEMENGVGNNAFSYFNALGKELVEMHSSLEEKKEELKISRNAENKLKAANEALTVQLKETEEQLEYAKLQHEETVKTAEHKIQQAESETTSWRINYVTLNEQLTAVMSEAENDKKKVESLTKKVDDNEEAIKDLEVKVHSFEEEGKKLNEQLTTATEESREKDKTIESLQKKICENQAQISSLTIDLEIIKNQLKKQTEDKKIVNDRYINKCNEFTDLQSVVRRKSREIEEWRKRSDAARTAAKQFEKERDGFRLKVEEQDIQLSQQTNKISNISKVLEEKVKYIQVKEAEIEKKDKQIEDLKQVVKTFEKEKEELPKRLITHVSQFWDMEKRDKGAVSCGKEASPEPVNGYNDYGSYNNSTSIEAEQLERQDFAKSVLIGKRKYPVTPGKKQHEDSGYSTHHDGSQFLLTPKKVNFSHYFCRLKNKVH